jgi:hypothetical protein
MFSSSTQQQDWLTHLQVLIMSVPSEALPSSCILQLINSENLLILSLYYFFTIEALSKKENKRTIVIQLSSLLRKNINKIFSLITSSPLTLNTENQENEALIYINDAYNNLTENSKTTVRSMFSSHFGDQRISFSSISDYAKFGRLSSTFAHLDFYHSGGIDEIHPLLLNYDREEKKYFSSLLIFIYNLATSRPCLETTSYIIPYLKSVYKNKFNEELC